MKRPHPLLRPWLALFSAMFALTAPAAEDNAGSLELGVPFVDRVVLQQGIKLPVWGSAPSGTEVTVEFDGQTHTATADEDQSWRVVLDPLVADKLNSVNEAPAGRTLTVSASIGGDSVIQTVSDILVGEVWLCAGQSNMGGPLKMGPWPPGTIEQANYPALRHWRDEKWIACTPETSPVFSRVAFCFAREVQAEIKVPIGLVMASVGGSRIELWMPQIPDKMYQTLDDKFKEALKRPDRKTHYKTFIQPFLGFGIRGALWYQGEGNDKEGREYFTKMETLITGWRGLWGQGDFPFYFVQIASIGSSEGVAPEMGDGRAKIRNAQLEAMKIENTGMAVTIDIGAVKEHPRNKYDVGLRLSRWALRNQYGKKELVPSGPIYKAHKVEGESIRVMFDYAENGLMLAKKEGYDPAEPTPGADMPWLSIQAKDGSWHWAKGKIDGNDLLVSSDKVKEPVAVRYAYTQYPLGSNLYNKDGLPASPFSTSGY